ncbi:MAG TPA: hypothetical protein GXX34_12105 [Clostridia bacterium]|nr:hypothetical protein [Clostridia bacterium]
MNTGKGKLKLACLGAVTVIILMAAGGHLRDNMFGIGFQIDPHDDRWQTSRQVTVTINQPSAYLMVDETVKLY